MSYPTTYHLWVIYLPTYGLLTYLFRRGAIKSLHGVTSMRTMKMNNEKINLSLNPNRIYKLKQNHEKLTTIWNVQAKVQTNLYYDKTWKCKHKRNKTRLWNKIIPQIGVKKIKVMTVLPLYIPLWGLNSKKFP
jgi:hypothetical protein